MRKKQPEQDLFSPLELKVTDSGNATRIVSVADAEKYFQEWMPKMLKWKEFQNENSGAGDDFWWWHSRYHHDDNPRRQLSRRYFSSNMGIT